MAAIRFRPEDRAQFAALVPQERAHIRDLMSNGVVEAIYVSDDGTRPGAWVVLQGESQGEVEQLLHTFPMHSYMQTELTPLS
jgi:muconolactone delta-isomerase